MFDGGSKCFSVDTNAILQISTSQNASDYTSFQDFKAGDFVARAVKFRLKMTSSNTQESPQVSALSLKLSLPTLELKKALMYLVELILLERLLLLVQVLSNTIT